MLKEKVRLGVIGLGKMGLLHASLLNMIPDTELVALCDKSALLTRFFKKMFASTGVDVVNNVDKFIGLDLDAVYITTPISSHAYLIRNLFDKGITRNIFSEKTLATNYSQAKELCEIAGKVAGTTMVGYMKRFNVVFEKAKELLSQRTLGNALSFEAYAYSSDFLGLAKESKSSASRGGALSDIGSHIIDLTLWLLGDLKVKEVVSRERNEAGSETSISFRVAGPSELDGLFNVSQSMPNYRMPEFGLLIKCTEGTIDVNDDRLKLGMNNGDQKKWHRHDLNDTALFSIGDPEYYREDQHFVNSLLEGTPCEPSFEAASRVDYLIDQVRNWSGQ